MRAIRHLAFEDQINRTPLLASVGGHVVLVVALLLYSAFSQSHTQQVVPVSIVSGGDDQNLQSRPTSGPELSLPQIEHTPTAPVSKTAEAPSRGGPSSFIANSRDELTDRDDQPFKSASGLDPTQSEKSLWNRSAAVKTAGDTDSEQTSSEASGLTITRRTEWQARPVEDSELTYSASGSGVKLTLREASSAGFSRNDLALGIGPNTDATSGLMPGMGGGTSLARSQRIEWTLVNLKNFGLTAFGYQNEVGTGFQQFGQTKTEFGAAGTSTMKIGSEVRIGAFGFGLAESSIANTDGNAAAYLTSGKTDSTKQQTASASVNLAQLMPAAAAPKLLPTLRISATTSQAPVSGPASETLATSFGGTWRWSMGYASLGYWDYSSGKNAVTSRGHAFDANLGAYRSSFGIDVGLSYGQAEDVAPSWQSAGAIYNSYATVSYKPDKLPGVSFTAAAGNYAENALSYGGTLSAPYIMTSNGEYFSLMAALDLTSLFWSAEQFGPSRPAVKLFYRYSDSLFLDGSDNPIKDVDSLVAMTIQRRF